jgi:hypothetical protein
VKALLLRAHLAIHAVQASRRVRVALSVVCALLVAAGTVVVARVGFDLQAQRAGIVAALAQASAKNQDPAAAELLTRRTVTVGDRIYGGARAIPNPEDLFNDQGEIEPATREDLAWRLVLNQTPPWMPYMLVESPVGTILGAAALLAALLAFIWMGLGGHLVEWGLVFAAAAALCWALDWGMALRALIGMGAIAVMFALLWRLAELALAPRAPGVAVARVTFIEGVRSLAAVGFAAPIAVLLPVLALSRDPDQGLYQAIPGFLDWGHTVVYTSAALLVILFGCGTTAFEIRDRQVWSVLTKPISRLGWMAGKWLGTLVLGCAVLAGGGVALYAGAHYMAAQPPISERDARDVRNAVLVARIGTGPELLALSRDRLLEIVEQAIESDSGIRTEVEAGRRTADDARREVARAKQKEFMDQQRMIAPGQYRDYVFRGLKPALAQGRALSLRYKLHAGADDSHQKFPLIIMFQSGEGNDQWDVRWWTPNEPYSYDIEPRYLDADGTLKIRLYNAGLDETAQPPQPFPGPLTIYFDPDGLEVMYPQASFGQNIVRALLVDLAKIGFLAALAVAAATLLSFPVAVLLAFGIFSMATLTPFLGQSLRYYYPEERSGWIIWAFQWAVKAVASAVEFTLSGFAQRAPSDSLAQGRVIALRDLAETLLSVGVLWTGGTLLLGWLAARRKEIAVYSGQS